MDPFANSGTNLKDELITRKSNPLVVIDPTVHKNRIFTDQDQNGTNTIRKIAF